MPGVTIDLVPVNEALIVPKAGYICERVPVRLSLTTGDVWENWVPGKGTLYQPSKQGLDKFFVAAGIKTHVSETEVTQRTDADGKPIWIWDAKYSGTYTAPSGIPVPMPGEYTYDVTYGGPRYLERYNNTIDDEVAKMLGYGKKRSAEQREAVLEKWISLTDEEQEFIRKKAQVIAERFCSDAAKFGAQRAETGARLRPVRTWFRVRNYTRDEIENGTFILYRTKVDHEAMREMLGDAGNRLVSLTEALLGRGISDPAVLTAVSQAYVQASLPEIIDKREEDEIALFKQPISKQTIIDISTYVGRVVPNLAPVDEEKLTPTIYAFLGIELEGDVIPPLREKISEGAGRSILKFYSMLATQGKDDPRREDWKLSCLEHIKSKTVWKGNILVAAEDPEQDDIDGEEAARQLFDL